MPHPGPCLRACMWCRCLQRGLFRGCRCSPPGSWALLLVGEIWLQPLFIQNKQMINCLISDCAGRHTTHVPAGGAAKRFILFNNKSKTVVAVYPLPACTEPLGLAQGSGIWPEQGFQPKEEAGVGLPSWHFKVGGSDGAGTGARE